MANEKIEYKGEWKNDDINGNREYPYLNGDKYKSEFKNKKEIVMVYLVTLANWKI